jgi:ParB/RepB/Spo0J family partition protein
MKAETKARELKPIGKAATLPLDALTPSASNRETRKDEDLKGLATSIKAVGLIYPLVVRPHAEQEGAYRIVAGERRWRAMKMLKLESAPCIVLSSKEDEASAEVLRVVENHQRRNLEPLEEAAAVQGLLDLGLEPEAVARSLGRSRAWVARRASLTEISERWLQEIKNPESKLSTWPPSHLEVISRFPAEVQERMLEQFGGMWKWNVPGFRELVELTGQFLHVLSAAPWKLDDEALCPEAGACNVCQGRGSPQGASRSRAAQ